MTVNEYYKNLYGHKVYKISLNAGMTCPNRDGKLGSKGCIFCSAGGSGDFAAAPSGTISEQIEEGILKVSGKYSGNSYIAYFQAFTNTYAPVSKLRDIFTEAISDDKISLLKELNSVKPVWVELGLQTIREDTAEYIRRGYTLDVFEDAFHRLQEAGIPVVVHVIIGLPGEDYNDHINTAKYLSHLHPHGIKLQLLHVLKGTDLAKDYEAGLFKEMSLEEYSDTVADIVSMLPSDIVIYRITGDGPKNLLIAPLWSGNKKHVLNTITKKIKERIKE